MIPDLRGVDAVVDHLVAGCTIVATKGSTRCAVRNPRGVLVAHAHRRTLEVAAQSGRVVRHWSPGAPTTWRLPS